MAPDVSPDDDYKRIIGSRFGRLVWRQSLAYATLMVFTATFSPQDFFSLPTLSGLTAVIAGTAAVWGGMCALLKLRQRALKVPIPPSAASSPQVILLNLLQSALTYRTVIWYAVVASIWTIAYTSVVSVRHGSDAMLGLRKGTYRYPSHWNERFVFLFLANSSFGVCLGWVERLLAQPISSKWPSDKSGMANRLVAQVKRQYQTYLLGTVIHAVVFTGLYYLFKKSFWLFVLQHGGPFFKPYFIHFARTTQLGISTLIFRLLMLHVVTLASIKLPAIAFDIQATQPMDFASFREAKKGGLEAERYLIRGLQSTDDYHLYFTFSELDDMAYQSARREAILQDLSTTPTVWNDLWKGTMTQFGRSYQTLVTRGGRLVAPATIKAAPAAPIPGVTPLTIASGQDVINRSPYIRAAAPPTSVKVLTTVKQADQQLTTVSQKVVSPIYGKLMVVLQWVWEQAKPSMQAQIEAHPQAKQLATKAIAAKAAVVGQAEAVVTGGEGALLAKVVPEKVVVVTQPVLETAKKWGNEYLARRWATEEMDLMMPRRELDKMGVRTLAAFVSNSLREDMYGQIQQNVPATLEAFAKYHDALLQFKAELFGKADGLGEVWGKEVRAVWDSEAESSKNTIERAVQDIVFGFGPSMMKAFKFPPVVAQQLKVAHGSSGKS